MNKILASLFVTTLLSSSAFAYTVTVEEVVHLNPCVVDCPKTPTKPSDTKPGNSKPSDGKPTASKPGPSPTPADDSVNGETTDTGPGPISTGDDTSPTTEEPTISATVDDILGKIERITTLGSKVWDFVVTRDPKATYNELKTSVVPEGIKDWRELIGWNRQQVVKTYRITFKDLFGKVAGGFDYRISYFYGGNYKGKGKFIGSISVLPTNISLHTDRNVNFHAEIMDPINFGTVEDPIAGVQLRIVYNSPTTLRYTMHSDEFMIYGTGEFQKVSP